MNARDLFVWAALVASGAVGGGGVASAQEPVATSTFGEVSDRVLRELDEAQAELEALNEEIVAVKLPLSRELGELEAELSQVRLEYRDKSRLIDVRKLDVSTLRTTIKTRQDQTSFISDLVRDYARDLESRMHIAELQRYAQPLEKAKLALENSSLEDGQVYGIQLDLLATSIERLEQSLGGTSFEGTAVDPDGRVQDGTFVLLGPSALFRSRDGRAVGTAEQRLGSLEPALVTFSNPDDAAAAATLVGKGEGLFPLDPSLGNAHKVEATEDETFLEHVSKGGAVMYPIFALAGAALLVAIFKWFELLFVRRPSGKQVRALLADVAQHNQESARLRAGRIGGPVGRMLVAGVENLEEPRELVEEVMYETVLTTRLRLERMLPFVAICAASAPLLGLLGTVTGIISTFNLITVFGSGDVKTLSGGISEALITTKFGLIVAIPSLLLHAYLSRKVRGVIGQMETVAVSFVNELGKTAFGRTRRAAGDAPVAAVGAPAAVDPDLIRGQVSEILGEMLAPLNSPPPKRSESRTA